MSKNDYRNVGKMQQATTTKKYRKLKTQTKHVPK